MRRRREPQGKHARRGSGHFFGRRLKALLIALIILIGLLYLALLLNRDWGRKSGTAFPPAAPAVADSMRA